jgi:hypothetical protein
MSDFSQGEGWWQASDGKWYPPESAPPGFAASATPGYTAPLPTAPVPTGPPPMGPPPMGPPPGGPAPTPAKSGLGTGPIVAIVVAAVVIIGAIAYFATSGGGDKKNVAATSSSSSKSSSSSSKSNSSTSFGSSGSAFSGAPDVVAPTGFKVFSNDADRFALAVPESYNVVDASSDNIDDVIDQLAANNPQLASMADQIKSIFRSGGKLVAIDPVASNGFSDNVNVLEAPGAGTDLTSKAAQDQLKQQLETFASNVVFDTRAVHGRTILTDSYEGTLNGPDGTPVSFFGRQAYVLAADKLWVITVSTGTDDGTLFDKIVSSFDVNE